MLPLLKPGNLYLTHRLVWINFSWIYFSLTSAGFLDYLAHHKRHSFDPLRGGGAFGLECRGSHEKVCPAQGPAGGIR
jgi:hypothetical protein